MRKTKTRGLLAALAIIFIVMFAANLAVLRIYFDVRLSYLSLLFWGDSPTGGDSSAEGSSPTGGDSSTEGDGSFKGDRPTEGDSHTGGDSSAESGYFFSSLPDPGDFEDLINELSLGDRITLAYIMSRIDADELNRLYDISQDGLTADEIAALREYAAEILDPSDIEVLEGILYKLQAGRQKL
jgi:hypothetical protein